MKINLGYIEVYIKLLDAKDPEAMKLNDLILKFGVMEVTPVENDKVKGEYLKFYPRGSTVPPVYFVGIHLDSNKEVVEMVA